MLLFLTLSLISSLPLQLQAHETSDRFEHLGVRQGLSQVTAYCVFEDRFGFIWVGTDDGLNRYDGYEVAVFQNDPLDERSLSNNTVNTITEDVEGRLWVGTDRGLNLFNRSRGDFTRFLFDFHDEGSLSSNTIWSMVTGGQGNLWVGTANGLNRWVEPDSSFVRYKQELDVQGSLSNNNINVLYTDALGQLWAGTNLGVDLYNQETDLFVHYPMRDGYDAYAEVVQCITGTLDGKLLVGTNEGVYQWTSGGMKPARTYLETNDLTIHSLHADQYGHLWIGAERGLYEYAPDKDRPFIHRHDEEREMSLSDDKVIAITEDKSGVLWFGTFSAGVEIFYREQEQFFHQERSRLGTKAFPSDDVHSLFEVGDGVHWIGTSSGIGVMSYFGADPDFIKPDAQLSGQLDIRAMCAFGNGFAVGTHKQGVYLLDSTGTITRHLSKKQEEFRLSDDRISDLLARGDALWIATEGGGLNIYRSGNEEPEVIKYDPLEPERLRDNRITVLAHGLSGRIWLGTASTGAQQYDPARNTFVSYRSANDSLRALSNDKVNSILVHDSIVWIGTRGGGLNAIDLRSGFVDIYTVSDGLSNNVVQDIESDDMGRLWISTNKGISVLDIASRTFTNYNDIDGLGNLSFNPSAGLRNSAGEILFGGRHGLDIIKYRDIRLNTVLPKVYFTAVKAFSNKLTDYDPQLSGPIWEVPERLEFPPDIDLVTIEFAGLNYRKPEKNRYAYRLAGLTEEWTQLEDNRQVTFSNLPPGNYSLEVKAANNDGLWSAEPASIVLEFLPAYYQTNWFRALVVLGILGLVYAIYMYRVKDVKRQNRRLENRVKSRTIQIVKERDEKAVLLKEIHHRVKNNLQIVNSMLRLQSYYVKDQEALYALEETQNRVMSMAMIHERMYKTENLANIDLEEYLTDLCRDIISTYDLRNSVKLHADIRLNKLNIDTLTPLGLIINEVASNAMKYAFPDGQEGTFSIVLERHGEDKLRLRVGDDGVGMPLDLSDGETDSLGTTLMDSLSDQLNGELIRLEEKGTMYELVFEEIHK